MTTIINRFSLSITGLIINYTINGITTKTVYDPCATCDLLKNAGLIEDFTSDKNGEPVILYTDNNEPRGYGYELWAHFIKSFPFGARIAEMLADYRESSKQWRKDMATITFLLKPLQAA